MGIEIALIAATTVMSAAAAAMQGVASKNAAEAQATGLEQQAKQEQQAAGVKIASDDYEAVQTLSKISANAGAAGVTMAGSPELVKTRSAEEAKINDMYTRYSGRLASVRDLYAADTKRYEGESAFESGLVGAAGSLLSGAVKGYGSWKSDHPTPSSSSSSSGSLLGH